MKIGTPPELPGVSTQTGPAAKQARSPAAAAEDAAQRAASTQATNAPAATASSVTVSSLAAQALGAGTRSPADFDANKVKAVRSAIEKGTFKVDAEAVADKMLANAAEILSHGSRGG
jgi:negative regulator of flagellin synthesis FlgM